MGQTAEKEPRETLRGTPARHRGQPPRGTAKDLPRSAAKTRRTPRPETARSPRPDTAESPRPDAVKSPRTHGYTGGQGIAGHSPDGSG